MGWNYRMRASRNPYYFGKNGNRRPGCFSNIYISSAKEKAKEKSDDYINRQKILDEIETRCEKNNENLDDVVDEIAQREEVKEQFNYFAKNGITDISSIFKNWYNGRVREKKGFEKSR